MGAGKTTLARKLAAVLSAQAVLEETARHPFIHEFYESPGSFAVETELSFLLLHYHQLLREKLRGAFSGSVITDFAFERDYVFAKLTLKETRDWKLFEAVYDELTSRTPQPDLLVYLRAPLDFLRQRIRRRGREYERQITPSYLESVMVALDRYFLEVYSGARLVLDAPDLDDSINPDSIGTVLARLS